jgi:hypothetical protein
LKNLVSRHHDERVMHKYIYFQYMGFLEKFPLSNSEEPNIESSTSTKHLILSSNFLSSSLSRCIVISDSGQKYEIDRYCPHKGADLSQVKQIMLFSHNVI